MSFGLYGDLPPPRLWHDEVPSGALQFSPLLPSASHDLTTWPDADLDSMVINAPAATLERQAVIAHALRALRPGGQIIIWASNDRGGSRLKKEMAYFGALHLMDDSRDHAKLCRGSRPDILPDSVTAAMTAGAPRFDPLLATWTQPGIFSWDRLDTGSALLLKHLPALSGIGADFGCGTGILSQQILKSPTVTCLTLLDIDRRAIMAAQKNITDPRAAFLWIDIKAAATSVPCNLDFVVMNPPFHATGREDIGLGLAFIDRAVASLRKGGTCWLVANRHLPYEEMITAQFRNVTIHVQEQGFKIISAQT